MKNCRLLENCEYIVAEIKKLEHICETAEEFREKTLKLVNIATVKGSEPSDERHQH